MLKNTEDGKIIIPEDTCALGEECFSGSGVAEVNVPKSVTTIEDSAFAECRQLEKIVFAEDPQLKKFGYYAFAGCTGLKAL